MDYQKIISKFIKRLDQEGVLDFAKKLNKKFPQSEVYLVGGAVRDALLNLPDEKDYDFVVRKVSIKELERFLAKEGKIFLVGKRFGVFKFFPKKNKSNIPLDIAIPRQEYALGTGGYRDFKVQSNPNLAIIDDLSRRDFTINAMAIAIAQNQKLNIKNQKYESKIKDNVLVDAFNGLDDLQNKIIRTVGNPEDRFKEDYSRMLRALRFSCQLNFQIEEKTWQAIRNLSLHLNDLHNKERVAPYEVIAKEFLKSFYCDPLKALDIYDESGVLKFLIPELLMMKGCSQPENYHSEGDVWTHTKLALKNLNSARFKKQFISQGKEKPKLELILAIIFHDIAKPLTIKTPEKDGTDRIRFNEHDFLGAELTRKIFERLKISSCAEFPVNPEKVSWMIKHHLLLLQGGIEEMKNNTIEKYFFNSKFNGQDLLKLFVADALASIPKKGRPNLINFRKMLKRIEDLKKLSKEKTRLPKSILDGHEIMKNFNLAPGKQIGELLNILREEQLAQRVKNKKEALDFLKNFLKRKPL